MWLALTCIAALGSLGFGCSGTADDDEDDASTDMDTMVEEDTGGEDDAGGDDAGGGDDTGTTGATTFRGEVWADNWSSMYLGDELIMEDSVSITTERSFNAEVFTFEATRPFQINVILKDFIENDSGLEYIGERNQQMGDGGYIAQLTDTATGDVVLVSNSDWRCLTIHEAPLNKECEDSTDPLEECESLISEEPAGWKDEDFDDSSWEAASVYSEAEVSPRMGYDEISWDSSASLIWGADLESHNTILCRVTVQ